MFLFGLLSQDGDSQMAAVRGCPMLPKKEALPGSQLAASILDGE